jgi:pimeloyl-ACP methyl ester carboxylesterase
LKNTGRKLALALKNPSMSLPDLNLSGVESQFLIGTTFRFILRDAIYSSQLHHNLGILRTPIRANYRQNVYREILNYSYADYLNTFLLPYYRARGEKLDNGDALAKASDLRTYGDGLRNNDKVRVIVNENDFLLGGDDLAWLKGTFGQERLTIFPHGGHLGNLGQPEVQAAIVQALR